MSDQLSTSLWHFLFYINTQSSIQAQVWVLLKCIGRCGPSFGSPRQMQIKTNLFRVGNMKYLDIYVLLSSICRKGNMELPSAVHAQRSSIHSYQRPRPTVLFPPVNKGEEIQICFLWLITRLQVCDSPGTLLPSRLYTWLRKNLYTLVPPGP